MPVADLRAPLEAPDRLAGDPVVRAQVALVRTLEDEVERRPPSSPSLAALRIQLAEETERLSGMLSDGVKPTEI